MAERYFSTTAGHQGPKAYSSHTTDRKGSANIDTPAGFHQFKKKIETRRKAWLV